MRELPRFDVYESPGGRPEAVRHGFSWAGALIGPGWVWQRYNPQNMAIIAAAEVAAWIFAALAAGLEPATAFMLFLAYRYLIGRAAHDWRARRLVNAGYHLLRSDVAARSEEEAITTVRPELVRAHPWIRRALRDEAAGRLDEAELFLERVIRESAYDRNLVRFARDELERIRRSRRPAAGPR